ncbi:hypothetical protein ANCCEY_01548 [Ancylostoma ceylanicum]|uniref:Uncharacterized protein n=1 Tax=Ancylostoma ceylanicum TaxID=53326 RepID=A0A0D6M5I7_9BILA|nr:hypothetical protein ANCCEY_01548 [Ancylostoma ceylanicum]
MFIPNKGHQLEDAPGKPLQLILIVYIRPGRLKQTHSVRSIDPHPAMTKEVGLTLTNHTKEKILYHIVDMMSSRPITLSDLYDRHQHNDYGSSHGHGNHGGRVSGAYTNCAHRYKKVTRYIIIIQLGLCWHLAIANRERNAYCARS